MSARRPTLILCDDMENDEAVGTDKLRLKLRNWFKRSLIPTGKEGDLLTIVVGTILHADRLLNRLLGREDFPAWLKRRFAACYTREGVPDPDGEIILCPEYWTAAQLAARRLQSILKGLLD